MNNEQKTGIKALKGLGYGLVVGWMVGMLWYVSLIVAFAAMEYGTHNSEVEVLHARKDTAWSRLFIAARPLTGHFADFLILRPLEGTLGCQLELLPTPRVKH